MTVTWHDDQHTVIIISRAVIRKRNISKKAVEKFKRRILCSVTFFANRVVYEVMWKNIVEWGRSQMTIWRMNLHAGYLRLKHTLEYLTLIDFPLQQYL